MGVDRHGGDPRGDPAIITPAAFAGALIPSAAGGWTLLVLLAAAGSWLALVRNRALVDFDLAAPNRTPSRTAAPTRPGFGRRET